MDLLNRYEYILASEVYRVQREIDLSNKANKVNTLTQLVELYMDFTEAFPKIKDLKKATCIGDLGQLSILFNVKDMYLEEVLDSIGNIVDGIDEKCILKELMYI